MKFPKTPGTIVDPSLSMVREPKRAKRTGVTEKFAVDLDRIFAEIEKMPAKKIISFTDGDRK